jgi:hypothetical protein
MFKLTVDEVFDGRKPASRKQKPCGALFRTRCSSYICDLPHAHKGLHEAEFVGGRGESGRIREVQEPTR